METALRRSMHILVVDALRFVGMYVPCDVTMVTAIKSESKAEARAYRTAEMSAVYPALGLTNTSFVTNS